MTLHVVYEAEPTGYVVYRRLQQLKLACIVVAPTKTRSRMACGKKTDRRDAEQLARLHRAGELIAIHVPDAVDESIRDLTRARAGAAHGLTRAKERLKSFLLRQGDRYSGKANWFGSAPALPARTGDACGGAGLHSRSQPGRAAILRSSVSAMAR